ncbi:MAG: hypothetical protein WCF36_11045 [Candidatus Nanopelagicales bacterium]
MGKPSVHPDRSSTTAGWLTSTEYNAHLLESILTHVAPALGWR